MLYRMFPQPCWFNFCGSIVQSGQTVISTQMPQLLSAAARATAMAAIPSCHCLLLTLVNKTRLIFHQTGFKVLRIYHLLKGVEIHGSHFLLRSYLWLVGPFFTMVSQAFRSCYRHCRSISYNHGGFCVHHYSVSELLILLHVLCFLVVSGGCQTWKAWSIRRYTHQG